MPTSTALIIAAIVFVFIVFGAVLAWADSQTRDLRRSESVAKIGKNAGVTTLQPQAGKRKELNAA